MPDLAGPHLRNFPDPSPGPSRSIPPRINLVTPLVGKDQPYPPITATKEIPNPIIPRRAVQRSRPRPKSIEIPPNRVLNRFGGRGQDNFVGVSRTQLLADVIQAERVRGAFEAEDFLRS
jgi:hypothetical protein